MRSASSQRGGAGVARALAAGALAFALAGCGAAPSAAPPHNTTGTATPGAPSASPLLAFSACMRAHGVPGFPDLSGKGMQIQISNGNVTLNGHALSVNGTQFQAAMQACRSKLPARKLTPQQAAVLKQKALQYAACMRAHGVPNFPDPVFHGGGVAIRLQGINPRSPAFQAANRACQAESPFAKPPAAAAAAAAPAPGR